LGIGQMWVWQRSGRLSLQSLNDLLGSRMDLFGHVLIRKGALFLRPLDGVGDASSLIGPDVGAVASNAEPMFDR
jgi:hypothetical protein